MQIKQLRCNKDFNFLVIRGGTMFNELTSYEMHDMYFRHIKDREMTDGGLAKINKKHRHELEDWMTPIEREEMLKECLERLVQNDNEIEESYFEPYEEVNDLD